jgi:triosephosphate isomerase (TIM)
MKKIFAANWKLQKTPIESKAFCEEFLASIDSNFFSDRDVFIFPQNYSVGIVSQTVKGSKISVGPQTIHFEKAGAFTGENSAELAKKFGCELVLLGHSERRQFFAETDVLLSKKVTLCESLDMLPVFCIGETLSERENNQTESVCFSQLDQGLIAADKNKRIVIAYEPVWAIGTGQVASPEQVQDIHAKIFNHMNSLGFKNFQILYGGSVKPDNAGILIRIPHVDGFLIGGASLESKSFLQICRST